ncbi:hypothetical protein HDV01_001575 [Terramyces sp. JEL0728]|nr:hypothetical protein HDV01_001575 [Terramyces sp. JEL0728]
MTETKTESKEIDLSHLYRPNNRGNKLRVALLPGTDIISRPSLWPLTPPDEDQDIQPFGKRKAIVKKRKNPDEDPYNNIKIEDIWQIPEKLEDCRYIESIKKTLKSRIVDLLSRELMRQVEIEGHLHRDLLSLDRILEGIDPENEGLFQSVPVDDLVEFKEVADEFTCVVNEHMEKMQDIRKLLIKAHLQKRDLANKLGI